MGFRFRFRKSFTIFPGVRINFSKTGIGASFGFRGFRVTKRADGKIQKTVTIPGTGVSFVDIDGKGDASRAKRKSSIGKCPKCGASYRKNVAEYCQKCGNQLQKTTHR